MRMYSLFDRKVREYGPPQLGSNDETVCRALRDGIPGSKSTAEKYPEDFDLYYVGDFDVESGGLVNGHVPMLVNNLSDILSNGRS